MTLISPSGLKLDMAANNSLQGGELGGLIELRDKTLVETQRQLDQIAAGLAQAFSTKITDGTAVTSGAAAGFDLDLSAIRSGNDFTFNYTQGGVEKSVRVTRVTDLSKLPVDYVDAGGPNVATSCAFPCKGIVRVEGSVLQKWLTIYHVAVGGCP